LLAKYEQLQRVREYLERGGFSERDKVPPERLLAKELGLTRARIRGCLRKLAAEGLIWRHVGKGTFFGPRPDPVNGAPARWSLSDLSNPREVMEARLAVEPDLARMASQRANARDFQAIRECLTRMSESTGPAAWLLWDRHFHRAIAQAAGNMLMLAIFDAIHSNREKDVWGRLRDAILSPERMREVHEQHEALFAAMRERDADRAAGLMRTHVNSVRERIFAETPVNKP